MKPVEDHLDFGLQIVFIGFNPSLKSGEEGHHYANPRNNFWRILEKSRLTPRLYQAAEDGELLKLGYGFTNIVARPTRAAEEITREEYNCGREQLRAKLERFRPKIACFVGKGVYTEFSRRGQADWGFQDGVPPVVDGVPPVVDGVREFVAPSSSGLVRMPMEEIVGIYRRLACEIREQPGEEAAGLAEE
ncbi:mismatch-specific DNA-glycosylase [Paenibacillus sp. HN-1]|uniref:mismatch-specific DNA-glycosylase n=1 Tax=Paenibacillus TaxID=44249 RepID=UPI001CA8A85D|nr:MULTISPECIES: mismatch-specific DNA-glycosylase [Paenibacillus]MBY9077477.1 mismatch-specific DNA-glycosylase [Paenibacillus sp. CGMCC 1.18879]MBY9084746.1 mismatch-specific DNA-glycosylase [Paenibacillus sinensis]